MRARAPEERSVRGVAGSGQLALDPDQQAGRDGEAERNVEFVRLQILSGLELTSFQRLDCVDRRGSDA